MRRRGAGRGCVSRPAGSARHAPSFLLAPASACATVRLHAYGRRNQERSRRQGRRRRVRAPWSAPGSGLPGAQEAQQRGSTAASRAQGKGAFYAVPGRHRHRRAASTSAPAQRPRPRPRASAPPPRTAPHLLGQDLCRVGLRVLERPGGGVLAHPAPHNVPHHRGRGVGLDGQRAGVAAGHPVVGVVGPPHTWRWWRWWWQWRQLCSCCGMHTSRHTPRGTWRRRWWCSDEGVGWEDGGGARAGKDAAQGASCSGGRAREGAGRERAGCC